MAEWERVAKTTLINYLDKQEVNIMRNRKLTALLQSKGRVSYNWSGRQVEQRVRYRRVDIVGYSDMDLVNFARQDRWKIINLPIRAYVVADAFSKKEKLMNSGKEAIIKLVKDTGDMLKDDLKDGFAEQLYVDGNATANLKKIHGIESFMAVGGNNITQATGFECPNDSYGGLSTEPNEYGGTWTGNWPYGSGSANYDFWSPIIIDYEDGSNTWGGDTDTWKGNCLKTLRRGIMASQRSGGKEGMCDLALMTWEMYADFLDEIAEKERIIVERGQSQLVALGFKDVTNYDGVDHTWEFGVPDETCYGFNCDKMELRSWQSQLFMAEGPDYDSNTKSHRLSADFFGNCFFNPRYFFKLYAYND